MKDPRVKSNSHMNDHGQPKCPLFAGVEMVIVHATPTKHGIDRGIFREGWILSVLRQPRLIVILHVVRLCVKYIENISNEVVALMGLPGTLRVIRNRGCRNRITGLVEDAWAEVSQAQTRRIIRIVNRYARRGDHVDRFRHVSTKVIRVVEKARV